MGQKLSVVRRGRGSQPPPEQQQPSSAQRGWSSLVLPASLSSNIASNARQSKNRNSSRSASTKSSVSIASRLSRSSRASRASRASTSGYWSDCGYMAAPRPPAIPRDIEPWGLIYAGPVHAWKYFAHDFDFPDRPIGCRNRDCERDSVCLESARATLNRKLKCFEIHRYNQDTLQIPYGKNTDIQAKLEEGFLLNEVVAAMRAEMLLLVMYLWDSMRYQAMFVLVDIEEKSVTGSVVWPYPNMSIMECMISPDKMQVVVLFYHLPTLNQPFQYDLGTFCTQTFQLGENMITCNKSVRPYTAFDPRYKSSRIAIVNYSDDISGIKNSLVLYCLISQKVVVTSPVKLSAIYAGGYFCLNFSRDGRFLILQKISDNMNGMPCYADTYVFNADNLDLLKHYFTNLQKHSALCRSNYAPLFSCCGSRMCIISEEMCRHDTSQRQLEVSVYQLPSPIRLQDQCRISIHQAIGPNGAVESLPLPSKLKVFLSFTPLMD